MIQCTLSPEWVKTYTDRCNKDGIDTNTPLNLYVIEQEVNSGYDTYSDAVVAAHSEEIARDIDPSGLELFLDWEWEWEQKHNYSSWANNRDRVKVTLIGKAVEGIYFGVICASFHAG